MNALGNMNLDMQEQILNNLTDDQLLNLCAAGGGNPLCNDDEFWHRRIFNRYGRAAKPANITWKQVFMILNYY